MAVIQAKPVATFNTGTIKGRVIMWETVTENDTPAEYSIVGYADKTVQIAGTLGGATFAIHGACHPTSPEYKVLTDPGDTDLTALGLTIQTILQHTYFIKPVITGGSSTDVDIIMVIYNPVN